MLPFSFLVWATKRGVFTSYGVTVIVTGWISGGGESVVVLYMA